MGKARHHAGQGETSRSLVVVLAALVGACHGSSTSNPTEATASAPSARPPVALHVPAFHRAAAQACATPRPAGSVITPIADPMSRSDLLQPGHHECVTDADCTAGKNGRCLVDVQEFRGARVGAFARCSYDACVADSDCGAGGVCICRDAFGGRRENICVAAACKLDANCDPNEMCSPSIMPVANGMSCRSGGLPFTMLRCHTASDECSDDSDCHGGACAFSTEKSRWICDSKVCLPD